MRMCLAGAHPSLSMVPSRCERQGAPVTVAGLLGRLAQVLQHVAVIALELANAWDACIAQPPVLLRGQVTCHTEGTCTAAHICSS